MRIDPQTSQITQKGFTCGKKGLATDYTEWCGNKGAPENTGFAEGIVFFCDISAICRPTPILNLI